VDSGDRTSPARRLVVVDGANVVGSRPDGWWHDRAAAAQRLLAQLEARLGDDEDVVLVLEGVARHGAPEGDARGITVIHAGGLGDDRIVEIVRDALAGGTPDHGHGTPPTRDRAGSQVIVVTADRELRRRVEALGAETRGPRWLAERATEN
jgi:hypothetical protein